ncbi:hypothetical protein [Paenibacillus gansuensis]|uniref:OCRE domain-containing protein n=1 Tax=Paenibacillus gansuensis TaxID=306542 RepID=A0ABW5PGF4_9BACL
MYNRFGERVRDGIGWIGDLGTGNGSPGSIQGPADGSGNTEPDYHPGNGNGKGKTKSADAAASTVTATGSIETPSDAPSTEPNIEQVMSDLVTNETKPAEDFSTELVKENPYRYAGYYWDRKTQYYYLQATTTTRGRHALFLRIRMRVRLRVH